MGRMPRLHHQDNLIETDIRPTLYNARTGVGVAANNHCVID